MKNVKRFLIAFITLSVLICSMPIVASAYSSTKPLPTLTGNQRTDIVAVAKSQVGYVEDSSGGTAFGAYYGNTYGDWCAYFVSWCADKANISSSIIARTGYADANDFNVPFKARGTYTPVAGDLIFFDYPGNSYQWDHVGIVTSVSNRIVLR